MDIVNIHEARKQHRLGFLEGEIEVPDDFDRMGEREVISLFGIDE